MNIALDQTWKVLINPIIILPVATLQIHYYISNFARTPFDLSHFLLSQFRDATRLDEEGLDPSQDHQSPWKIQD